MLGACRSYNDVGRAERVAKHVIQLNENSASGYVLLGNTYSQAGLHTKALEVRQLMKARGVRKTPGKLNM